jgi:hypothetical protein
VGLTERLAHAAARRPRVLLVPVPGHRPLRWAAEDALDRLGWGRAASPAEADLLLCGGAPGPELLAHVEVAWDGVPGPRARAQVVTAGEVEPALLAAAQELTDVAQQRQDARTRATPALSAADAQDGAEESDDAEAGMDMDHDMDMDMAMDGMDHSMHMHMSMDLPGGLAMADRMDDRDGLRLEGLSLSLGPLLPGWPPGLRLDVGLSGDVLTRADVVRLDPRPEPPAPTDLLALDALALLLEAAGWSDGALRARRARREGGDAVADVLRRTSRARLLRWSLRGLPGPVGDDLAAHLDRLVAAARGDGDLPQADDDGLARDVVGLDLGTAALVLAAHAPLLPVAAHA